MRNRILTFLLLTVCSAQAQQIDYDALTLEDLVNMKVTVASIKELPAIESPGVITVISREEIECSGARDLMDILETVPGFDFGADVEGVVGLGVRGNWAHEGKVLLLIDGQVMNEGLYSTLQFGNHYSIKNIRQIEIMRGPGSVNFGDYAEYAVINIITQNAEELNGFAATAEYGFMSETFARRGGGFAFGKAGRDFSMDLKAGYVQANRSDFIYTDVFGNDFDFTHRSSMNNCYGNFSMSYKGLSFRAMSNNYRSTSADEYEQVADKEYTHDFNSYFLEIKHQLNAGKAVTIENRINYKDQLPWANEGEQDGHNAFNITTRRYSFNSQTSWDPFSTLNVTGGIETLYDISTNRTEGAVFSSTQKSTLDYINTAIYGQLLWKNKIATVTAGARQNLHSMYNSSLVPRFGVTRTIGRFHVKALYSISYRAPGAQNIDLGINIKPELTTVKEVEAGCSLNEHISVVVNIFDVTTKNCILYYYDKDVDSEGYINKNITGTQGLEAEIKYIKKKNSIRAGYSYYTAENKPILDEYAVPGENAMLLAFPNHKGYLSLSTFISRKGSFALQAILSGRRYYIGSVIGDMPVYSSLNPSAKLNIIFCQRSFLHEGISLLAGIYNITNTRELYIQPYNSMHAPLPGTGREFRLQVSYEIKHRQ